MVVAMVVGAALAVAAMTIIQVSINAHKASEGTILTSQSANFIGQLHAIFQNDQSCRWALKGPQKYGDPAPAGAQDFVANPGAGNPNANIKIYYPDGSLFIDPADSANNTFGAITVSELSVWRLNPATPPVLSTDSNNYNIYDTKLNVVMLRRIDKAGSPGAIAPSQRVSMEIWMKVAVNAAGKIVSCLGTFFQGNDVTVPQLTLVPVCDVNKGQVLWSDGKVLRCVAKLCASPMYYERDSFAGDGVAICWNTAHTCKCRVDRVINPEVGNPWYTGPRCLDCPPT
jgi:hypothetical protein